VNMSKPQFDLFKTKRFWPLFATQFLGAFNDNVFKTALVAIVSFGIVSSSDVLAREFLVSEETATFLVTLAPGLFILPFFLFSAIAGQLADKLEKSKMIRYVKMFEIVIMTVGAIGFFLKSIPLLMVVLFLMGTQSTFFGPLKYAIIPDHLKESELIGGNALVESGTFLAILIGTILGGLLPDAGLIIVSVMVILFAIVGFLTARQIPVAEPKVPDLVVNKNFLGETFSLMKEVYKHSSKLKQNLNCYMIEYQIFQKILFKK